MSASGVIAHGTPGGACLCSEDVGSGQLLEHPMTRWAVFPAPDEDVSAITLRVPGFGQLANVPMA